jgi:uroporphyrinogen-III decarboxylase
MDPFSVTLGVVTLVGVCSKVSIELKKLRHGAREASTNINAMLADLKALKAVLDLIEDGFEELDGSAPMTGFIGAHWKALQSTLTDGCASMKKLEALLVLVNKNVQVLDTVRRGLRLKEANDQIAMYRQEIQAYKDALQLSFQSVIL